MKFKKPFNLFQTTFLSISPVSAIRIHIHDAPNPTTPVAVLQSNTGCVTVSAVLETCRSLTPDFTTMVPASQAPCLCYEDKTWLPKVFDNAVEDCAEFAETALPDAYAALQGLEGFCASVGNVGVPSPSPSSTSTASPIITLPPVSIDKSCYTALSLLQLCNGEVPGFIAAPKTLQAACLCYTSVTRWVPDAFDNAVGSCGSYASSASGIGSVVASVTMFEGICGNVGDILGSAGGRVSSSVVPTSVPKETITHASTLASTITVSSSTSSAISTSSVSSSSSASLRTSTSVMVVSPEATEISTSTNQNQNPTITKTMDSTSDTTRNTQPTTSPAVDGYQNDGNGNGEFKEISDPVVIAVSFVCAALVLFLC